MRPFAPRWVRPILVSAALVALAGGCVKSPERYGLKGEAATRPSQARLRPSFDEQADHLSEMEGLAKRVRSRYVWIESLDISLPQTPGQQESTEHRNYGFSVYAHEPGNSASLEDQLQNGDLQVDVLGVPASMAVAHYSGTAPPQEGAFDSQFLGGLGRTSRSAINVVVRSQDLNRSFVVVAWYKRRYAEFEVARRARIARLQQLICDAPAGPNPCGSSKECLSATDRALQLEEVLSEPNPWGEVRTVRVFNGDLETRINMVSRDEVIAAFGPTFEKYFFVGKCRFRNLHDDKDMVVYTTSMAAKCLFYRLPNTELAGYFLRTMSENDKRFAYAKRYEPIISGGASEQVGATRTGIPVQLVNRISGLGAAYGLAPPSIVASFVEDAVEKKFGGVVSAGSQLQEAREVAIRAFESTRSWWTREIATSRAFGDQAAAVQQYLMNRALGNAVSKDLRVKLVQAVGGPDLDSLEGQASRAIEAARAESRAEFVDPGSPVSQPIPVLAGPTRKVAAYSPYIFRQGAMAATGYLFEDYYRPMSFRAVLTSLFQKTEDRNVNQALNWLESLGAVAGALVGLDSFGKFFEDPAYSQGVAVGTGVVLPELRKRLSDDREDYIKNLEKLSLDNQFTLKRGQDVDGYVYFPKGPIFGFGIDEFTVDCPTYLVNIDSVDVSVEAMLVSDAQSILSGETKSQVAADFLNAGTRQRSESEAKTLKLQANARLVELQGFREQIEDLIRDGKPSGIRQALRLIQRRKNKYPGLQEVADFLEGLEATVRKKGKVVSVEYPPSEPVGFLTVSTGKIVAKIVPEDLRDEVAGFAKALGATYPAYLTDPAEKTGEITFDGKTEVGLALAEKSHGLQFTGAPNERPQATETFQVVVTYASGSQAESVKGTVRIGAPIYFAEPVTGVEEVTATGSAPADWVPAISDDETKRLKDRGLVVAVTPGSGETRPAIRARLADATKKPPSDTLLLNFTKGEKTVRILVPLPVE